MIKRYNIFIVVAALIISASFWIIPEMSGEERGFSYKIFKTGDGWGYDVLVNNTLQIHQDYMPVVQQRKGFPQQEQARQAAMLVIKKLKAGKNPAISAAELELICR